MKFPSLSASPVARTAISSAVGVVLLLLVTPLLLTISTALLLSGASILTTRRRFYEGRQIDLLEFSCPADSLGDFLWHTRLNQLPTVFNVAGGDVALDARLLTLLDEVA